MVRRNHEVAVLRAGKRLCNPARTHSVVSSAPARCPFLYAFAVWIALAISCCTQAAAQQDISTVNYGSKPVSLADALRSTV